MLRYDFRATASWNHVFKDTHITNLLPVQILPLTAHEAIFKVGVCNMAWENSLLCLRLLQKGI